jgi:hypothetical protein
MMICSNGRNRTFELTCSHCGATHSLLVNSEDIIKYQAGALVQDAFPYLSAGERELIISRTCDSCWTNLFGDNNED